VPDSTQRKKICQAFDISEAELFGASPSSAKIPVQRIPVISWVHANKFEEISDPFPPGISDEYIYSAVKGDHIFALRVHNNCMEPEFLEGDLIIVKPNVAVNSGDYIIVADRDENKATFKQYKEYGNKKILHPLNPKYQDIELDHKKRYVIVGKVVEKIKKYQ
jgi:SOS-response transcriptional repressor LexA